ncbi:unnamed protein product [Pseudo-nitzschia multistriata]|uniref:Uncharacterized protein n=1 Tax=Pseudo-nitzschia multistriata TaxID=183589 RepID=A0A448ZLZ2_9STRA|nr:unnamed protein product [Pseudo-nitzschia multistriata]
MQYNASETKEELAYGSTADKPLTEKSAIGRAAASKNASVPRNNNNNNNNNNNTSETSSSKTTRNLYRARHVTSNKKEFLYQSKRHTKAPGIEIHTDRSFVVFHTAQESHRACVRWTGPSAGTQAGVASRRVASLRLDGAVAHQGVVEQDQAFASQNRRHRPEGSPGGLGLLLLLPAHEENRARHLRCPQGQKQVLPQKGPLVRVGEENREFRGRKDQEIHARQFGVGLLARNELVRIFGSPEVGLEVVLFWEERNLGTRGKEVPEAQHQQGGRGSTRNDLDVRGRCHGCLFSSVERKAKKVP